MLYNERTLPHNKALQYLLENNYHFFRAPMYLVDQELGPLRNLIRNSPIYSQDEYHSLWSAAYNKNNFYQELCERFSGKVHNVNFILKAGDFILEINNNWHLIELKTSSKASPEYHINFDCYLAYESLTPEVRRWVYILFYNDHYKSYSMAKYSDLVFENKCFIYPEVTANRFNQIRDYGRFFHVEYNNSENVPQDIDKTTNAYFKINLNNQKEGVVKPLHEYIKQLKEQLYKK